MNEKTQTLAQQIDEYYDRLLHVATTTEQIVWIEQQRDSAHRALMRQALGAELDGWQRPGRM